MTGKGEMWYPELPDKTCPVCQIPVKYEAGYYDKKPIYRCRECGYVVKTTSEGSMIAMICLATVGFCIISYFIGQLIVGVSPNLPGAYGQSSFFRPPPSPGGVYSSSGEQP